jgi:hypothetical protein
VSRHAAGVDPDRHTRVEHVTAAGIAAVTAAALAVAAGFGRTGLAAGIGVVQAALVVAWVFGTGLPGRIGGLLLGAAAAGGADAVLLLRRPVSLAALLGVLALCLPAMLVHQLSRGVVRVRVTESVSGVTVLCTAVTAVASYLALDGAMDGHRMVFGAAVAAGAALAVCHLVDIALPAPRFAREVPHGLLAVLLAVGVGALAGGGAGLGARYLDAGRGAVLGAVVAGVASLVAVGVGYLAQTVEPRRLPLAGLALPYLRVALPLAFTAPVAYLLGLYLTGGSP